MGADLERDPPVGVALRRARDHRADPAGPRGGGLPVLLVGVEAVEVLRPEETVRVGPAHGGGLVPPDRGEVGLAAPGAVGEHLARLVAGGVAGEHRRGRTEQTLRRREPGSRIAHGDLGVGDEGRRGGRRDRVDVDRAHLGGHAVAGDDADLVVAVEGIGRRTDRRAEGSDQLDAVRLTQHAADVRRVGGAGLEPVEVVADHELARRRWRPGTTRASGCGSPDSMVRVTASRNSTLPGWASGITLRTAHGLVGQTLEHVVVGVAPGVDAEAEARQLERHEPSSVSAR